MKILNTTNGQWIRLFWDKLAVAAIPPTPGAKNLFLKLAPWLAPLAKSLGRPGIQLYEAPFNYGGRHFEIDATWVYPDGAQDGIQASFMVELNGCGFLFLLTDPQHGTILETRLGPDRLGTKLPPLVRMIELYCSQQSKRVFIVP